MSRIGTGLKNQKYRILDHNLSADQSTPFTMLSCLLLGGLSQLPNNEKKDEEDT
jgi:hypothetical protein